MTIKQATFIARKLNAFVVKNFPFELDHDPTIKETAQDLRTHPNNISSWCWETWDFLMANGNRAEAAELSEIQVLINHPEYVNFEI